MSSQIHPATPPRVRNLLSHRNREFHLLDEPLEHYFHLIGQRPCKGEITAEWEIEDGWLYLTGLSTAEPQDPPLTLDRLFPFAGRRVFAAWYSGQIRGLRSDRPIMPGMDSVRRYPDLILSLHCGHIESMSQVHRNDLLAGGRRVPARAAESLSQASAKVLAFMPRGADANWNPGWQGALV